MFGLINRCEALCMLMAIAAFQNATSTNTTAGYDGGDPYLFLGGDLCEEPRCDCYDTSYSCVGDDVYFLYEYVLIFISTYTYFF